MRIAGLVLAGGEGRRMGGADKALLRLNGATLADHVIGRLASQVAVMAVSYNGDSGRFSLPVLPDAMAGQGPMAGILAGLRWARAMGADRMATAATDTPFFPADLVARLAEAEAPVALAAGPDRLHATFGLWTPARLPELEAAMQDGERSIRRIAGRLGMVEVSFPDDAAFFNINTAKDLADANARH
ncbi:molybdenum cofactor guanylyltransferase MobA [Falsirhodobacter halotolerans]|uniref:molybdenum cofactor guanylyltransferase MobA n=1 Tax=Falsirhodobacter halotolerans TaxID=1146892 RepID=UPI001FD3C7CC|nr:molybdenum cofactor guanylyltransferase MobA [Falsirhodobacter halotolerans]MCJ8140256.1 molybdenum cofactor guanylyltransferase [Falsirhodobacter halotolerans]